MTAVAPIVIILACYLAAVAASHLRGRPWPVHRTAAAITAVAAAAVGVVGPVADRADHDFAAHVTGHLLVGMLAPYLLVLAAPGVLALRALPGRQARVLRGLLASAPAVLLTHPVVAAVLDMGGLWLLYRGGLYSATSHDTLADGAVHLHMLVAGYLFVWSMIGIEPAPRRPSYRLRAMVLVLALAAHAVLAKSLYAQPPPGVPVEQAETAALLMWYGGDAIHLLLIVSFCRQWLGSATLPARVARRAVTDT